jgi:pimeloyl-ACP methyl ester carboxylesterase
VPQFRRKMQDSGLSFIASDGIRLCLERRGHGARHVLFAHGWISSRRMWYEVASRIDPAEATLHLLDFRGCGLSDRPLAGHDLAGYAADLRAALAAVGAPVTLVAHSMGGRVAQYVAAESPPNLHRLILVAPGTAKPVRVAPKRRELAHDAYGSRERIERFQRAAMAKEVAPEAMLRIVDDALLCQYEHWMEVFEQGRVDFASRLASIAVPVLAIAGEKDPLAPPARIKRDVTAAIAGSLLVALRGAGHNLPIEAPEEIAAAVARFQ